MNVARQDTPQNPTKENPPVRFLLSEVDAAAACGVSRPTWRKWVALGLIRPVSMPQGIRRNLYRASAVEALADRLAAGDVA